MAAAAAAALATRSSSAQQEALRNLESARGKVAADIAEAQGQLEQARLSADAEYFRAEDDARMREAFLDALPPDTPGRIRELQDYRFVDPEAQRHFDELMHHLREQVMGEVIEKAVAEAGLPIEPITLRRGEVLIITMNRPERLNAWRRMGIDRVSMGMSADYETAVRLGATHVRVGTALFGSRGT